MSVAGYWTSGLSTPVYFDHTEQQREKALADAPGLTVDAIDHLLREAYVKGHDAGRAEGYIAGRKDARPHVEAEISNQMRREIKRIVGGQLIHIARRLNDRRTADKGKTIAAEREWAFGQGEELWRAIREIEAV